MIENFNELFNAIPSQENVSLRVFISVVVLLSAWIIHRISFFIIFRNLKNENLKYSWRKVAQYLNVLIVILIFGRVWLQGFQPIVAFLSIIAAALTITQKESIMNMMGSVLILWRDLFVVGDRIEVNHQRGDVVGLGLFYFTLVEIHGEHGAQSTGRIVKIPNGMILTHSVFNYTKGFPYVWSELPIVITLDSDWKAAKTLMFDVAESHTHTLQQQAQAMSKRISDDELIVLSPLSPIVYFHQRLEHPMGFTMELRFLTLPRKQRDLTQQILEDILTAIEKHPRIHLVSDHPL